MGRLSPSPAFFAESLSICAEASRNILAIINRFRDFRQLECHPQVGSRLFTRLMWQSVSTIVLASLTILYSLWEKKNETTKQEIEREMAMSLDILDEIGQTYGPTRKLHQALANLVAATIENLERSRNGTKVQGVTFGSPIQSLVPPPMQLPMRIDTNLRFDSLGTPRPPTSNRPDVPRSTPLDPSSYQTPISWQDPVNGQTTPLSETQAYPSVVGNNKPNTFDPLRISPSGDVFEDSMLWGPSLEWAGGWDDFLNAIAM